MLDSLSLRELAENSSKFLILREFAENTSEFDENVEKVLLKGRKR